MLPPRQQPEPVVEALGDPGHRDVADAGRRELDGERDAVEPLADQRDVRDVLVVHREVRTGTNGAVDEQLHRVVLRE